MNKIEKLSLFWHTVKYLRMEQIIYRVYYKFVSLSSNKLIKCQYNKRQWISEWSAPELFEACIQEDGTCDFLGKQGQIRKKSDWHDPNKEKLWLYHLHYMHDLNAKNAINKVLFHQQLIEQWIINNPPVDGHGWEPYPLSLRIVNFVKWFSRHENEVTADWLTNLGLQAQALASQIEYHILANHLFVNAKALTFVGAYLEGKPAAKWLKKGLEIIDKEIAEQFLPDGGHFELSPMYHANLIWDVCDLLHLSYISNIYELKLRQNIWIKVIEKGLTWLAVMSHPDGEISFFNDAAFGMAPKLHELRVYAAQLGVQTDCSQQNNDTQVFYLPDSGYYSISNEEGMKAIIDLAKVGADYQPGHAHADSLSFELSLFSQRFIVNTGTSEYGDGPERHYQRSTLAHNTVCVDNQNSSVVWSGFRVAQRAIPKQIKITEEDKLVSVSASHTGYERSPLKVSHRRNWIYSPQKLIIEDQLQGVFTEAQVRFHFHPHITIVSIKGNILECYLPQGQVALFKIIGSIKWVLEESYWCSEFGKRQVNQCLNILLKEQNKAAVEITW